MNSRFITGLPRTRTYWFSQYFNGLHEPLNGCKSRQEFYDKVDGKLTCDCGLIITDWQEHWPDSKTVIIHRDVNEVIDSLSALMTVTTLTAVFLKRQARALKEITGLHINFEEINDNLKQICDYLGEEYRSDSDLINKNLQLENITGDPESLMIWER